MDRRNFIQNSAAATTALLISQPDAFTAANKPTGTMDKNFQLKMLATNWGFNGNVDTYCAKVKEEGYDGIEMWWPDEKKAQDDVFAALKKYKLEAGFLFGASQNNHAEHLQTFKDHIQAIADNTQQRPLYINCHSGRDHFSFEENKQFIDFTTQLSVKTGIKILHETHRSRILFSAPSGKLFMSKIPELRITFDVSHWCCVHESLLQDQAETLALAVSRTDHVHARIGHPEGPQVNDPRAPEWDAAVKAHFAWWDKIVEIKKQKGETLTVLTEFGPPDYMPTLPYTRQPVADQWDINVHIMKLFRSRYQ